MFKKLVVGMFLTVGLFASAVPLGNTAQAESINLEDNATVERNFDIQDLNDSKVISESPIIGLDEKGNTFVVPENNSMLRTAPTKKLIGDYILSGQDTISLANSMKTLKGLPLENSVLGILVGVAGKEQASIVLAATIASRNAAIKKVVISAANSGSRLRVLIWDEVPHTSYSTTVQFIAIR